MYIYILCYITNIRMDIETLFKDGINYLKSNWKLPEKGFIAGGSI